tara:strand:+ start:5493 stop:5711 length:219 start_codon:yes stop_codon:yes gene_type:complete
MVFMTNEQELLTLEEVAQMLKCHPNTLRDWDNKGILPAVRLGEKRIRRYRKSDVERFIEQSINENEYGKDSK